ncbi:MAG TPA: serine hydrolase [Streptosporangiaceae bacterium]|nr:serine hydrolase [Streptosporangiaceae bacterium]
MAASAIGLGVTVAAPAGARAAAASRAICVSAAHPLLAARMSGGIAGALRGRRSAAGLAVADPGLGLSCRLDAGGHFVAASAIKVTILAALLLKAGGAGHLTAAQRSLARAMITQSSNAAADRLWAEVGISGMQRFLNRAGMTQTRLNDAWGLTELTAADELTLLRLLTSPGPVLTPASRSYVLTLMAQVIVGQRWGTPAGLGAFAGPGTAYQMAILTSGNPSMAYGIDTIQGAARVINRAIAEFVAWQRAHPGATIP